MTWKFLTDTERNRISHESGPYIFNGYAPHEAAVREANPRSDWKGLTPNERNALLDQMPKPFYVAELYARIEEQLKARNPVKMQYAIDVLQSGVVALETAGIQDHRISELKEAIKRLEGQ